MNTFRDLFQSGLYWPGVIVAVVVAVGGALLSVPVVLKRLAFIGQGVSHAAFGGVGLAAVLGLTAGSAASDAGVFGVVAAFCVAAALGIAWLSERSRVQTDTAIGIVLAVSMGVGFLLLRHASEVAPPGARPPGVESVLFGSLLTVGWVDAIAGGIAMLGVVATLWWVRRPMLFWAFDDSASAAFGVRDGAMKTTLLVLLAITVVVTMKLAGVVLATALLVLPGAIALRLSDRLGVVLIASVASALVGVLGGVVVSLELDWQTGPAIVLVLAGLYGVAWAGGALRRRA
ncbi:MAG: metal ABC transporter permease [Phycisphaerales bacterium]